MSVIGALVFVGVVAVGFVSACFGWWARGMFDKHLGP